MFRKDRDVTGYLERKVPGDIGREYDFVSKEQDLRLIDALEEIYAETGKILRITFFFLFRVRYVTIKTVCVRPGIQGAYSKNRQGKADG